MPMVMVESFQEFITRHGGDCVTVRGWMLFPDGTTCNEDFTIRRQSPSDPTELLNLRREYVQAKLKQADRDFRDLKNDALDQAHTSMNNRGLPPPGRGVPNELTRRKGIVEQLREQLASIEAEYAQTPEAQRQRRRDAEELARQTTIASLAAEIQAIEI